MGRSFIEKNANHANVDFDVQPKAKRKKNTVQKPKECKDIRSFFQRRYSNR